MSTVVPSRTLRPYRLALVGGQVRSEPSTPLGRAGRAFFALVKTRARCLPRILALAVLAALALVVVAGSVGAVIYMNAAGGPVLVVATDESAAGMLGSVGPPKYRSAYFESACVSGSGKGDRIAILGASSGQLRDGPSDRGANTVTALCGNRPTKRHSRLRLCTLQKRWLRDQVAIHRRSCTGASSSTRRDGAHAQ
jgi:hypothetical protein